MLVWIVLAPLAYNGLILAIVCSHFLLEIHIVVLEHIVVQN